MIIGVPREILENERRVAALPETAAEYARLGFRVLIESSAGQGAYRDDREYAEAGAQIVPSPEALLPLRHRPQSEAAMFQPGERKA